VKTPPVVTLILALTACGPSFHGTVSGYPVNVQDELYVPLTDSKGASNGALLIVSDQTSMCSELAAPTAPGNATLVLMVLQRRANGAALSADMGKYTVDASGPNASEAVGGFLRTDANGTQSIPGNNANATSGVVDVTQYSSTDGMAGSFDGKFGQQLDAVQFQFAAHLCDISMDTLSSGFIGRAAGWGPNQLNTGSPQTTACADMVACVDKVGTDTSSYDVYRASGTCWTTTTSAASACDSACRSANSSFQSAGYGTTYGCTFSQ
jgi:hypothetical protein